MYTPSCRKLPGRAALSKLPVCILDVRILPSVNSMRDVDISGAHGLREIAIGYYLAAILPSLFVAALRT